MKIFAILLFPLISFAQTQFPDTLFLIDGRTYPCLITSFDNSRFYFSYPANPNESIVNKALEMVYMDTLGIIYKSGIGFISDKDDIMKFIEDRTERIKEDQNLKEELNRLSSVTVKENPGANQTGKSEIFPVISNMGYKKWSFGILYVPYYSGSIYRVLSNTNYPPTVYGFSKNQVNMEAQLTYALAENDRVTFDMGYTSSFEEDRNESHQRGTYSYDDGSKSTMALTLLDFNFGLKYFFRNIIVEEVNIYAAAGFGKQIAFVQNKSEDLFPEPQPGIISEDNIEEFTRQLNSPWHFNIEFGAEYFFNQSLSLKSNIRVLYSSVTGKYNSRYVSETENDTQSTAQTIRNVVTRIGIGFNFYF